MTLLCRLRKTDTPERDVPTGSLGQSRPPPVPVTPVAAPTGQAKASRRAGSSVFSDQSRYAGCVSPPICTRAISVNPASA